MGLTVTEKFERPALVVLALRTCMTSEPLTTCSMSKFNNVQDRSDIFDLVVYHYWILHSLSACSNAWNCCYIFKLIVT